MKPQILVTPKKGKLIGAKDNEGLCDTLEWMKNVCNNFKGDGMTVEVDRTDEDVPIIRLSDGVMQTLENIEENGGGGGGGECEADQVSIDKSDVDNKYQIFGWGADGRAYQAPIDEDVDVPYEFVARNTDGTLQYVKLQHPNEESTTENVKTDDISIENKDFGDEHKIQNYHFNSLEDEDKENYQPPDEPASSEPSLRFLARKEYTKNGQTKYELKYVQIYKNANSNTYECANEAVVDDDGFVTGIKNIVVQWERRWISKDDVQLSPGTGTVYIVMEITHPVANAGQTWPTANDIKITTSINGFPMLNDADTTTTIPLYKCDGGKVVVDYRNTPCVPVWR